MDYEKAAAYWTTKDAVSQHMDRAELLEEIEKFISAHTTCALATGSGDFVRCTPLEYTWKDGAFWMMSEGGRKFAALEHNKNVCLAVFDPWTGGSGNLGGLQVSGTAEIVEPWNDEYTAFVEFKKLPVDVLKRLPSPMNLIKVTPQEADFLESALHAKGVDSRQHYTFFMPV
jgi:hypothetical protein